MSNVLFSHELFGIFVDGDNMNPQYYEVLHELISKRGKIILKKVYGDFTEGNLLPWKKTCLEYGIDGVMAWRESNKNSSDMKMATDLMEILQRYKHLNNFVIVTGDIDFKEICRKIVAENKRVIGVSCFEKSTSKNLQNYCSEFIILNNVESLKPIKMEQERIPLDDIKTNIVHILSVEPRSINLGLLKTKLLHIFSSFHETNYGFKSFKDFMSCFEPEICVNKDTNGNIIVFQQSKEEVD